jgi:PPOX class probable FMN-dependent enzyme
MTRYIDTVEDLEALYGKPAEASLIKVADRLTDVYRDWVMASKFCIISTVGPEGTDASPRGDATPVVQMYDEQTLLLPDWRGNNRIDTLRTIVRDPRVSLMFMVPGSNNVVRINGEARVTADPEMLNRFDDRGQLPRSVAVIRIREVYFQCARALMRSGLWSGHDESAGLPTPGEMLKAAKSDFDGGAYDAEWAARAKKTLW